MSRPGRWAALVLGVALATLGLWFIADVGAGKSRATPPAEQAEPSLADSDLTDQADADQADAARIFLSEADLSAGAAAGRGAFDPQSGSDDAAWRVPLERRRRAAGRIVDPGRYKAAARLRVPCRSRDRRGR